MSTPRQQGKSRFYIPQLDCLRFFCFFAVFLHHNLTPGTHTFGRFGAQLLSVSEIVRDTAAFGLSLFFFLSSYLITSLLMIEQMRTGTVNLSAFYVRRILRIWPLYFAFLLAIVIAGIWIPAMHLTLARIVAMSFLLGNWYNIAVGMGPSVVGPLWSISVEEQFYAIWPSVFRAVSRRAFVWFAAAVAVSSVASIGLLAVHGWSSLNIWLNSASEALFFAAGALLALLLTSEVRSSLTLSLTAMVGGAAAWVTADVFGRLKDQAGATPSPWHAMAGYVLVALGCALLLVGFRMFPERLVPRWLVYLGKVSYGLYVFHALASFLVGSFASGLVARMHGIGTPMVFAVSVALASLSYRFLEKPFLKLKGRFELVKTRAA